MGRKLKHSEALLQFAVCFLFNFLIFFSLKSLGFGFLFLSLGVWGLLLVFRVYKISPWGGKRVAGEKVKDIFILRTKKKETDDLFFQNYPIGIHVYQWLEVPHLNDHK